MILLSKLNLIIENKTSNRELLKNIKKYWRTIFVIVSLESLVVFTITSTAVVSRNVLDNVVVYNSGKFGFFLGIYGLLQVGMIVLISIISHYRTIVQTKTLNELQSQFLTSAFLMSWDDLSKYHSGDIVTRLTVDVGTVVSFIITTFPAVFSSLLQLTLAFVIVLKYDVGLALYSFLSAPIVAVISYYLSKKIQPLQRKINETESQYRVFLNESVQNNAIIRTFENENQHLEKMSTIQKFKLKLIKEKKKTIIGANFMMQSIYITASLIAFGWGAYKISLGIITFGMFTAIMQLLVRMQTPIESLIRIFPKYITTLTALERCNTFFSTEHPKQKRISVSNLSVGVQLKDIHFQYEDSKPVISNFNLIVNPGEKIAIMGESGIGKTTLLRILMGLVQPISGYVKSLDSDGLKENNTAYYTYVPQGNTLFSGSIRENMYIGNPEATDDEIESVLKIACADNFIGKLEDGIDTELGEKGLGLSEGQLQRLCIARALLRKAPVLLLDEATSALDKVTEENVIEGIYKNFPQTSVIAITHRSTILNYVDRVIQIDDVN
ncbi:MAG: ABC transporter ATP-binding protein [Clostridiales bacterium]|nr:ABC transporter ATP-binding protein [Clostridiales bacterium]